MTVELASYTAFFAYLLSAVLWVFRQRTGLNSLFAQAAAVLALAAHVLAQGLF